MRRVGDELSINPANANGAKRPRPRNIADRQRRRSSNDADNIRIVLSVRAQQQRLHLHFVVPTFGKERTNRPIDQSARQNFLFRRPTFALKVTAGKTSGGSGFLAIINRERKELLPWFCFRSGHSRD